MRTIEILRNESTNGLEAIIYVSISNRFNNNIYGPCLERCSLLYHSNHGSLLNRLAIYSLGGDGEMISRADQRLAWLLYSQTRLLQ